MEKKKHAGGRPVGSKTLTKAQKQRKLADENSEKKGMRKLTDNQLRAAQLWVYGKEDGTAITTKKELSDLLGISYSVVHGYFSTEWFLAEIDRLQKEQARENKQQVARYVPEAIDAIVACMRDPESNARERINAAKTILDIAGMNDKTVNVNVGGEIGVVRGGFGRDVIISIHAPREGSDDPPFRAYCLLAGFQSTLPVRGATSMSGTAGAPLANFNPRSP